PPRAKLGPQECPASYSEVSFVIVSVARDRRISGPTAGSPLLVHTGNPAFIHVAASNRHQVLCGLLSSPPRDHRSGLPISAGASCAGERERQRAAVHEKRVVEEKTTCQSFPLTSADRMGATQILPPQGVDSAPPPAPESEGTPPPAPAARRRSPRP